MKTPPPHGNDWARVLTLELRSGKSVSGKWYHSKGKNVFRTLDGKFLTINATDIKARKSKWYVSFPPAPAIVMLVPVKLWGLRANDVLITLVFAAAAMALFWLLLAVTAQKGWHHRSFLQSLVLTGIFAFGTAFFWASVRGEVWFTAHIFGVFFLICFLLAVFTEHPILAGFALSAAFLSRTPMIFASIFYAFYLWRKNGFKNIRGDLVTLIMFSIPVIIVIAAVMTHNYLRFHDVFEFGHNYLDVRWQYRIQKYGLFNYEYLSRNLSVVFTLLPRIKTSWPFIQISPHGMALWLTTPVLFYMFRANMRKNLIPGFVFITALMALLVFSYQNSGFVQYGYRFSIDFTVFILLIITFSGIKFTRVFYALAAWGLLVNTFGALTFSRFHAFYPPGNFLFFTS